MGGLRTEGRDVVLDTGFSLPRSCDIEFDKHLVGNGWHAVEDVDVRPFRWMGLAECATVMLAVDRSAELVVSIDIIMVIADACWTSFRFFVDGLPLPEDAVRIGPGRAELVLPATGVEQRPTELKICNSVRKVPAPDPRKVSVAVSRLTVRPREDSLKPSARLELRARLAAYLDPLSSGLPMSSRPPQA